MKFGKLSKAVTLESFNNYVKPSFGLFYYGCNFRCGFCHNYVMLGKVDENNLLSYDDLIKILKHAKRSWKQVAVIGGGEPTLSLELFDLLRFLKNEWEFEIKLDTNGSRPDVIKKLIDEKLVDYFAMDIKGTKEQYEAITGFKDISKIDESIKLIKEFGSYEFRTTVLPNFHTVNDFDKIGEWIKGSKNFFIQQFRPDLANGCLDSSYCKLTKIPKFELEKYVNVMKKYVENVRVR